MLRKQLTAGARGMKAVNSGGHTPKPRLLLTNQQSLQDDNNSDSTYIFNY